MTYAAETIAETTVTKRLLRTAEMRQVLFCGTTRETRILDNAVKKKV